MKTTFDAVDEMKLAAARQKQTGTASPYLVAGPPTHCFGCGTNLKHGDGGVDGFCRDCVVDFPIMTKTKK